MNLKRLVAGTGLAALLIAVPGFAEVTYRGDRDAVAVCKAIVSNDRTRLKQTLLRVAPKHMKLRAVKVAESMYQCNGVSLAEFAARVGASQALTVLRGTSERRIAAR